MSFIQNLFSVSSGTVPHLMFLENYSNLKFLWGLYFYWKRSSRHLKEEQEFSQLVAKNQALWLTVRRNFPYSCHMQKNRYRPHYVQEKWLNACSWYSLQNKKLLYKMCYSCDFSIMWIQCTQSAPDSTYWTPQFSNVV